MLRHNRRRASNLSCPHCRGASFSVRCASNGPHPRGKPAVEFGDGTLRNQTFRYKTARGLCYHLASPWGSE